MTVIVNASLLRPSSPNIVRGLHYYVVSHTALYTTLTGLDSKEVIRPQVPLRPPCYDFSLVADPRFDSTN